MNSISKILTYAKPYWKMLIVAFVAAAFFGITAAIPTLLLKHTIDDIFIQQYHHLIIPFLLCFIILASLKGLFMYLSSYAMQWVNNRVINDIRNDMFERFIHFPVSFFQKHSTGTLMSHFLNDVQMIQQAANAVIRDGVRSFCEGICYISIAFYQNAKLGLLLLIMGPVLGYVIKRLGRARKNASLAIQKQIGSISAALQERIIGIREIKAFNAEDFESNRFKNMLVKSFQAILRSVQLEAILPALVEVIAITGCAVIFYIAILQVLSGTITAGQLTAFVAALVLAYQPLKKISAVYSDVQYGLAAADRLFALMESEKQTDHKKLKTVQSFSQDITFSHVSFEYLVNQPVLQDLSFSIKHGQAVGIMGPSGSGKSTLCDLLAGFILPTSGTISIDGTSIANISVHNVRSLIGYVGQKTFLFDDTIFNNIAYANAEATEEMVMLACKQAHAHEFISALPQGYKTIVGENGTFLSGGQKQRLTIARALLKNPQILIFDEATSALDQESESAILQTIDELRGKKTLIIISHRPAMLHNLDCVFTINDGALTHYMPQQMCAKQTVNHPF